MILQTGAQVADKAVQGLLSRIDQLAEKLGTTAANVWTIYVAQARVEAIRDAAISGLALLVLVPAILGARRCWIKQNENRYSDYDLLCALFVFLSLGSAVLACAFAYASVGEFVNPQFWAFQHITADIKGLL